MSGATEDIDFSHCVLRQAIAEFSQSVVRDAVTRETETLDKKLGFGADIKNVERFAGDRQFVQMLDGDAGHGFMKEKPKHGVFYSGRFDLGGRQDGMSPVRYSVPSKVLKL